MFLLFFPLMAGFGGLMFVVFLAALALVPWLFGIEYLAVWNAFFFAPARSILTYLFEETGQDAILTVIGFGILVAAIMVGFRAPGNIAMRGLWRSASASATHGEWRAMRERLELLFGEDTEEFGLYLRRLMPTTSVKSSSTASRPRAIRQILLSIGKALLIVGTPLLGFCVFLAAFHALHQEFADGGPVAQQFKLSFGGSSGSFRAFLLSDVGLITIILLATAVHLISINVARQTFALPRYFFNYLALNLAVSAIVLWFILPTYFLLFVATSIIFHSCYQLLWMFALRPLYLRLL